MAKSEFERAIVAQGNRLLQVGLTRRRFTEVVLALGGLGMAACSASPEVKRPQKPIPQINRPAYTENPSLTPEQHSLAQLYSQNAMSIARQYLTNGYLERVLNFDTVPENVYIDLFQDKDGSFVKDNIFRFGNIDDDTRQDFFVFNTYAADRRTLLKSSLLTGTVPGIINLGAIPGRPFGDDLYGEDIPQDQLRTVAESIYDFPPGLDWKPDVVVTGPFLPAQTEEMYVYQSLKAAGKIDGRTYEFEVDTLPSAGLWITEPIK